MNLMLLTIATGIIGFFIGSAIGKYRASREVMRLLTTPVEQLGKK